MDGWMDGYMGLNVMLFLMCMCVALVGMERWREEGSLSGLLVCDSIGKGHIKEKELRWKTW